MLFVFIRNAWHISQMSCQNNMGVYEKKRAEDRDSRFLKAPFMQRRLLAQSGFMWVSLIVRGCFLPLGFHHMEPSQCWWVWVDGEWQAKTLPVNQQGCLALLLRSLGDTICVILPGGISPPRCLHPPSAVPRSPCPPLLLPTSSSTVCATPLAYFCGNLSSSTSFASLSTCSLISLTHISSCFSSPFPVDLLLCSTLQLHPPTSRSLSLLHFSPISTIPAHHSSSIFELVKQDIVTLNLQDMATWSMTQRLQMWRSRYISGI